MNVADIMEDADIDLLINWNIAAEEFAAAKNPDFYSFANFTCATATHLHTKNGRALHGLAVSLFTAANAAEHIGMHADLKSPEALACADTALLKQPTGICSGIFDPSFMFKLVAEDILRACCKADILTKENMDELSRSIETKIEQRREHLSL